MTQRSCQQAVLARMPPDAPISQLAPVAEALLGRSSQRRREAQMLRAMEKEPPLAVTRLIWADLG